MATKAADPQKVDALPEWIRILPLGKVELVDQREPFEVDQESLRAMVADFRARGVDLVIDYEHQSLQGERAPAAGWIKGLEAREDGLWGRVDWTPQAREYLRNREYRYFSPVLKLDPQTRRPRVLMQVGLTNVPAIKCLAPLVAKWGGGAGSGTIELIGAGTSGEGLKINQEKEKGEMREKLTRLLGLPPVAAEEALWGRVLEVFRDLAAVLKLPEEASVSQMQGAMEVLKAGAQRLGELQEELEDLKARQAEETAAKVVEEALEAGKITPAQKDWAYAYCRRDLEGFSVYVAQAPKLVPTGEELRLVGEGGKGGGQLLPEELALCRSLNLPAEEYLKAKAQAGRPIKFGGERV
jgi:phage I-like protein